MNKIKKRIAGNIRGKKVLWWFIVANLVYAFMLLVTIPKIMSFSQGMKILDMMPAGYNYEYVYALFDTLGEKGRNVYLYNQIPVDMIYPLLFGICYCLLLAYFLNKIGKLDSPLIFICLLPIIAGISDYMENMGIIIMLNTYPDINQILVLGSNIATLIKSSLSTIYFISLIIVIVVFGIKKIRGIKNIRQKLMGIMSF